MCSAKNCTTRALWKMLTIKIMESNEIAFVFPPREESNETFCMFGKSN